MSTAAFRWRPGKPEGRSESKQFMALEPAAAGVFQCSKKGSSAYEKNGWCSWEVNCTIRGWSHKRCPHGTHDWDMDYIWIRLYMDYTWIIYGLHMNIWSRFHSIWFYDLTIFFCGKASHDSFLSGIILGQHIFFFKSPGDPIQFQFSVRVTLIPLEPQIPLRSSFPNSRYSDAGRTIYWSLFFIGWISLCIPTSYARPPHFLYPCPHFFPIPRICFLEFHCFLLHIPKMSHTFHCSYIITYFSLDNSNVSWINLSLDATVIYENWSNIYIYIIYISYIYISYIYISYIYHIYIYHIYIIYIYIIYYNVLWV